MAEEEADTVGEAAAVEDAEELEVAVKVGSEDWLGVDVRPEVPLVEGVTVVEADTVLDPDTRPLRL